jgi:CarD family transcriptional regulator
MHGAGVISDIIERDFLGEKCLYYTMKIGSDNMDVLIPVDKCDKIGVRGIVDKETIDKVFAELGEDMDDVNKNWNKRYRQHQDQIKTGEILEVANVVKNLILLDEQKGLSAGEKRMLGTAKNILVSEVSLVLSVDAEEAEKIIDSKINRN